MDIKDIFNKQKIYAYIDKHQDILKLNHQPINDTNYILLTKADEIWSKEELANVIKAFHIRRVELDGEQISIKSIYSVRPEPYEKAVNGFHRMYVKKIIFLIKNTGIKSYLKMFEKQKFIILAKPDDEKNTKLNFMRLDKTKTIPVFTDSYEVDNFIIECLDNNYMDIKKYSPMCLNFKELYYFYYLEYSDFKIVIDPCAQQIKDINFSFILSNKLIKYIYSIRK